MEQTVTPEELSLKGFAEGTCHQTNTCGFKYSCLAKYLNFKPESLSRELDRLFPYPSTVHSCRFHGSSVLGFHNLDSTDPLGPHLIP
jgi:hypothetical protein